LLLDHLKVPQEYELAFSAALEERIEALFWKKAVPFMKFWNSWKKIKLPAPFSAQMVESKTVCTAW
jgi:chromosome segregation ATPase